MYTRTKLTILICIVVATCLTPFLCSAQNQPPIARAGADKEVPLSWNYNPWVYGTTSTDSDGWIAAFRWEKVAGPEKGIIVSPNSGHTRLDSLVGGLYIIRLTVTDNKGAESTDDVQVNIIDDLPPPPVDTIPGDTTITDSTGGLRRIETLVGTIEYISTNGTLERTTGKKVREIWWDPTNQVEYPITRSITTDAGKVIDRMKHYRFFDATQRQ